MRQLEIVVMDMKNKRAEGVSWFRIGLAYGINKATARLIANGRKPGPKVAKQLNVQCYLPAPACAKCGRIHVTKRCTDNDKPASRAQWVRVMGHAGSMEVMG